MTARKDNNNDSSMEHLKLRVRTVCRKLLRRTKNAEEKTPRKKRRNPNGLRLVRLGFWTFRRDFHALKDSAFLFSAY